ncbi:MAG: acetylglutamate kinase [bacterium]|nr:acetylglutamate kinase [bacterium]
MNQMQLRLDSHRNTQPIRPLVDPPVPERRARHGATRRNARDPLVVIKLGGSALEPHGAIQALQLMLERESLRGRLVVVHGGSPEISTLLDMAGLPSTYEGGLRVTTESGAALVAAALCGLVAPRVLAAMAEVGIEASSLSGLDDDLLRAEPLDLARYGQVGDVPTVDPRGVWRLLDDGVVPLVAPIARGPSHQVMNVNGDVAAGAIARALGADRLDLVTTGPLRDAAGRAVDAISTDEIDDLIEEGVATDGMIPKLRAARFASEADGCGAGVPTVRLGGFDDFAAGLATRIESDAEDERDLRISA